MITCAGVGFAMGSSSRVFFGPFPVGTVLKGLFVVGNSAVSAILYASVGWAANVPASEAEFELLVRRPFRDGQTTPGWLALAFPAGFSSVVPLYHVSEPGETFVVVQYEGSGAATGCVGVDVVMPENEGEAKSSAKTAVSSKSSVAASVKPKGLGKLNVSNRDIGGYHGPAIPAEQSTPVWPK